MKRIALNERVLERGKILEKDIKKLPEGVLCRVAYPICNVNEMNANKRIYEQAVWDKVFANKELKEKMDRRVLFGHAEHPEVLQSNLEKTSHVVTGMSMNESKNKVLAEFDVLDTPYGRIVDTILRAGCDLGCSTRAEGELEESVNEAGEKFMRVIPEAYNFITVDFTADPSTYGSYPEKVERAVVTHVKNGIESKKIDEDFATQLLEHLKVPEALSLLESIKKSKVKEDITIQDDGAIKVEDGEKETQIRQTPDGTQIDVVKKSDDAVPTEVVEPVIAPELPPETPEEEAPKAEEEAPEEEAEEAEEEIEVPVEKRKLTFESYDEAVEWFKNHFAKMEEKEKKAIREKVLESSTPSKIREEIKEANIKLGESLAERQKAEQVIKETENRLAKMTENYSTDIIALTEKSNQVMVESQEVKKQLKETKALQEQIAAKDAEIKALTEEKSHLTAKVKEAEEKVNEKDASARKATLEKYVDMKVSLSGLALPENAIALLKHCSEEKEVDTLFEGFREALCEDLLHSGEVKEFQVQNETFSGEALQVYTKVRSVMSIF